MEAQRPSPDPRELLRRFRRTYATQTARWSVPGGAPDEVERGTPDTHPLDVEDLPVALREQLAAYRSAHPHLTVVLVKRLRAIDGDPRLVVDDDRELPDEQHLLTLSRTVTLNAVDAVHVVTDLYVAELRPAHAGAPPVGAG